jgi:hypothetical protein
MLYSCFFDFRWPLLLSAVGGMTLYTVPGISLLWGTMGIFHYFQRRLPREIIEFITPSNIMEIKTDISKSFQILNKVIEAVASEQRKFA